MEPDDYLAVGKTAAKQFQTGKIIGNLYYCLCVFVCVCLCTAYVHMFVVCMYLY